MTQEEKDKLLEKWQPIIDAQNRTTTLTKEELEEWFKNNPAPPRTVNQTNQTITLPVAQRVFSKLLGDKALLDKIKLRESRINKLRKLKGEEPNVVLDKPFDIVEVKPVSGPIGHLYYMDFKYGDEK